MLQATILDCLFFDLFPFSDDVFVSSEVDIRWRDVAQTFVVRHCQIKPPLSGRGPRSRLSAMTEHSPFRYFNTSPEIIRLAVIMYT